MITTQLINFNLIKRLKGTTNGNNFCRTEA